MAGSHERRLQKLEPPPPPPPRKFRRSEIVAKGENETEAEVEERIAELNRQGVFVVRLVGVWPTARTPNVGT